MRLCGFTLIDFERYEWFSDSSAEARKIFAYYELQYCKTEVKKYRETSTGVSAFFTVFLNSNVYLGAIDCGLPRLRFI